MYKTLFNIILFSIILVKNEGIYAGEFVGSVELKYGDSLSQSHKIKLLKPLEYRDSNGIIWIALEGTSIETEFLTHEFLSHKGFPHPTEYIKSHVIYSAQAEQASGNWKEAQKMLYSALLDEGNPLHIAGAIYAINAAYGWRWETREGSTCYYMCHSRSPTLKWKPVINEEALLELVTWALADIPSLEEIDEKAKDVILSPGPHIFAQVRPDKPSPR